MLSKKFLPECCKEPRYYGGTPVEDVTSRVEPWDGAKPYYEELYAAGFSAFEATNKDAYPGPWYAANNVADTNARNANVAAVLAMGPDAALIRTHAEALMRGDYLDPATNPFVAGAVDTSLEQLKRKFTDEIYPIILDKAIQTGAYGGTAHDVIVLQALEEMDFQGAKIAASIYYENYTRERQLQENATQLLAVASSIELKVGQIWQAIADTDRGLLQILLNENIKEFEELINSKWRGIAEFSAVLTGGSFSTTSTTDPSKQTNQFANLFQGTLGGVATGFSVGGPVGGAIGGLIGGIGGLFM